MNEPEGSVMQTRNEKGERRFPSITGNRWWHAVPPDEVRSGDLLTWACQRLNRICLGVAESVHHGRKHHLVRVRQAWDGGATLPKIEARQVIDVWRKGRAS